MFSTSARQGGTDTESGGRSRGRTPSTELLGLMADHRDAPAPAGRIRQTHSTTRNAVPDLTRCPRSDKLGELPRRPSTERSVGVSVRARSLRTQQRVNNRCQQPRPAGGTATTVVGPAVERYVISFGIDRAQLDPMPGTLQSVTVGLFRRPTNRHQRRV